MNAFFAPDSIAWSAVIWKLSVAILCPLAIGLERFFQRKPIDFRPYVIISVVACALMIGTDEILALRAEDGVLQDPTKVMQGVITGIGFLGAGAMYREGDFVKGAGTAASIWSAGAIGLICGAGELWLAMTISTLIVLLMLASAPFTGPWDNDADEG